MAEQQTPAQRLLGDFAPKIVQLTDDVLFGDVWKRPGLSPRDRSLVTIAVLAATYRPGQLISHLRLALANGLTQDELVEALTHLAFYARLAVWYGSPDATQDDHRRSWLRRIYARGGADKPLTWRARQDSNPRPAA